ncbi:MAG: hypothetical protein K8W52_15255 [Deltaproteobacteria bacterium]|nr:hypothetical protein [Deltaproteobacteria bacterium]
MTPRPDNGIDSGCNVVVVSDVHLGEDLLPGASGRAARDVGLAEAAFTDFVRHLTRTRQDGRPWRLVINGDGIDLMLAPTAGGAFPETRTAAAALARIDLIIARHPGAFEALARFAAAGNRVDLVAGNHDLELIWPEVGAHAVAAIAALAPGVAGVAQRIAVRPWFVYEPGLCWIEHGHQYDATCSFEYGLAPADPRTGQVVDNLDYAAARHLGGAAPDVDPRGTEAWGFGGFLRYGMSLGASGMGRMLGGYWRFVRALWHARGIHRSVRVRRARAEAHDTRLASLAVSANVSESLLRDVDGLRRPPITMSVARLAELLMLDRWALAIGTLLMLVGTWALAPSAIALVLSALIVGGAYALGGWLASRRNPDNILPLKLAAARIRGRVDAPFVVFGHTHEALHEVLPSGGAYLNSGTWLPAIRPGLLRAFTHVVLRRTPSGPVAELRQWRDGGSRRFDSDEVTPLPAAARAARAA